jgi:hypothetical protein
MNRTDLLSRMRRGAKLTWWFTSYALVDDEATVRVPTELVEGCLHDGLIHQRGNTGSPVMEYELVEGSTPRMPPRADDPHSLGNDPRA